MSDANLSIENGDTAPALVSVTGRVYVKCEICQERIAAVSLENLSLPLTGAMFDSPDAPHGVPAPFESSLGWEFFKCPWGRTHRPFALDNRILTDQGYVTIGAETEVTPKLADDDLQNVIDKANNRIGDMVRADFAGDQSEEEPDISDEDAEAIVRAQMAKNEPFLVDGKPVIPPEVGVHECEVCGKPFSDKKRLNMHSLSHRAKVTKEAVNE